MRPALGAGMNVSAAGDEVLVDAVVDAAELALDLAERERLHAGQRHGRLAALRGASSAMPSSWESRPNIS
jgi:hypothetical protein